MNPCNHVHELNEWQVSQLREHLSRHRYYLGEQGIYLDDSTLELDFMLKFLPTVAADLRSKYCSSICPEAENCELAKLFLTS